MPKGEYQLQKQIWKRQERTVGHKEEGCSQGGVVKEKLSSEKQERNENLSQCKEKEESLLGPWIQVQRKKRGYTKQNVAKAEQNMNSFMVLDNPTFEDIRKEEKKEESHKLETVTEEIAENSKGLIAEKGKGKLNEENEEQELNLLSKKISMSFRNILQNVKESGGFLDEGVDPEQSRNAERKGDKEVVQNCWEDTTQQGMTVGEAQKVLQKKLMEWNKNSVGCLENNVREALTKLRYLEDKEANVGISDDEERWYEDLWAEDRRSEYDISILRGEWKKVSVAEAKELVERFKEEKIWEAINGLGRGESPGSDGFILEFYLHCWDTIKKELKMEFEKIHEDAVIPSSGKETMLVMIPKKEKS
ncbi:hypothetical protein Cni_G24996 [Canna indica]|uniref:Uncharacterized protein n=1 Tax=Canna indica TaxID=4628 RepID=A0AAQ3QLZ0_9LILI|nr:hypothetical protein Cni_G24996 [Canna indica]